MNIESIIEFINNEFPQEIENINTAIEMLVETLVPIRNLIVNGYSQYSNVEYTTKFNLFRSKQFEIDNIIESLNNYAAQLNSNVDDSKLNIVEDNIVEDNEISKMIENNNYTSEKKSYINYKDQKFFVDNKKPHTLYEDYTHKQPCAFEINGIKIEVCYWKEMLLKVCSYLWKINRDLFKTFLTDKEMNGSNRKYFSYLKNEIASPQPIENSNIYVIGNISANHARNIIIRLLSKYKIPKSNFKIYLCKDFSSLHIMKPKELIDIDEIKIGQHIRDTFENIFSETIPYDELKNLQDKSWCQRTFGINYAVLKLYQQDIPFDQQRKYNGYNRYYKELYDVNGEKYLLCSQWFKGFRIRFDSWVKTRKINVNESTVSRKIKIYNGGKYGSVELDDDVIKRLMVIICNRLKSDRVLIVKKLREECNYLISSYTKYHKSPQTVLYCMIRKLVDLGALKLHPNYQKGRYVVNNTDIFLKIIHNRDMLSQSDDKSTSFDNVYSEQLTLV